MEKDKGFCLQEHICRTEMFSLSPDP